MLQFHNSLLILVLFSTFLHESAEYSSFCLKMDWPPHPLWRHIRHYGKRSRNSKNTSENNWTIGFWKKEFLAQNRLAKIPENLMRMASLLNPAALLKLPLQILSQQCQSLNEALEHLQPASNELASRILNIACSSSMSASWYPPESLTKLKQQTGKNLLGCHSLRTII